MTTDYYYDGTNGNDATGDGSEAAPYKTIKNATVGGIFNPSDVRFFIKRGTTVEIAGNAIHPQGPFYIGPYGGGEDWATLLCNNGGTYYLATGTGCAAGDIVHFDSIKIVDDDLSSNVSGVYQNDSGSGTIKVTDCYIQDFFNGIMTQRGTAHQLLRNTITGVRNAGIMIEHASVAAPSNMLIFGNYVDATNATNDGIVLHAGTSNGYGNVIRDNIVIAGLEQAIDVLQMFPGTIVDRNICYSNPAQPTNWEEIFCRGANSVISRNLVFTEKRRGIMLDNVGITAKCNIVVGKAGLTGGVMMQALGTCTNFKAYNNMFYMPVSFASSAMLCNSGVTTGTAKNNLFINASASVLSRFINAEVRANLNTWDIDNNYYVQLPGSNATPWAAASSFAAWTASTGTPDAGTGIVATETPFLIPSYQNRGQHFDLDKILTILHGNALIEEGAHIGYSTDITGKQFWNPPSIGPIEYYPDRANR